MRRAKSQDPQRAEGERSHALAYVDARGRSRRRAGGRVEQLPHVPHTLESACGNGNPPGGPEANQSSWFVSGRRGADRPIDARRGRDYGSGMSTAAQRQARVRVPFLDLAPSHEPLKDALLEQFAQLIETGAFTNGPQVSEFEAAFASFCRTNHCVGVA